MHPDAEEEISRVWLCLYLSPVLVSREQQIYLPFSHRSIICLNRPLIKASIEEDTRSTTRCEFFVRHSGNFCMIKLTVETKFLQKEKKGNIPLGFHVAYY